MKKIAVVFIILALLGLIDATYLTVQHYRDVSVVCFVINTCDQVLQSSYATVGSIPVSFFGVFYYLVISVLSLVSFVKKRDKLFFMTALLTVLVFIASLWFVYIQIFLIHSFCLYCLFSALDSITLFILGIIFLLKSNTRRTS